MLADLAIGDMLVRKADGGRRPKVAREIAVHELRRGFNVSSDTV